MSSIPVNNNLNVLANIVNQTSAVTDSRNAKDSFDMVMNRVSSQSAGQTTVQTSTVSVTVSSAKNMSAAVSDSSGQGNPKGASTQSAQEPDSSKTKQTDSDMSDKDVSDKNVSEKDISDKETSDKAVSDKTVSDKEVSDADKDMVSEAGEELVEAVAAEMGIAIEEVEEVMEILGLSAAGLLDPENMKQLLITLSGNEDNLAILTDGDLYGHLQNMLEMVDVTLEELSTQLGLSEEELNVLIAGMAQVDTQSEPEILPNETVIQDDKEPEVNLEGMKDYAVTVHKDGETIEVKVKVDDVSGEQTSKEEVKAAPETQTDSENRSGNKQSDRDLFGNGSNENKGNDHMAGNFVMQNPIEQPIFNETIQQPVMERYVSTEDIMNQIMESMKINLKDDVQELEMHLHPASLGNVHVQITAKEGMVTAQFIAQNETVKAVIETQLIQLKTQFEEQGVKVDEVEVAVGDYRFDHSFAGDEENQQGDNAQKGKKGRRNINLSELDLEELPEDMDDSERIAAEMMALSGNMVDYTA